MHGKALAKVTGIALGVPGLSWRKLRLLLLNFLAHIQSVRRWF